MGSTLQIETPRVFQPLLKPSRYKGIFGGRGGAKSHFFADQLIDDSLYNPGLRAVCIREYQVSLEQSVKRLLEDKIKRYGLSRQFRVLNTHIETPGDGIIIFQGMQAHNAESIKSLEGYDRAWVEEAQNLSQRSLELLRPTIRKETCRFCREEGPIQRLTSIPCRPGHSHLLDPSELWFSWNPSDPSDPVDNLLRHNPPPDSIVIRSSYLDNPFFPAVLRKEMEWDRSRDFDKYVHVWEGEYEKHSESRVFKNWKVEEFDTPDSAVFNFGGDWGFSIDPSVLVRSWMRDERTMMIDAEAYQVGTEIDYLPTLFDGIECGCVPNERGEVIQPCRKPDKHGMARRWRITADSARPETISYLSRHGYPLIEAAVKGPNSVKEGVIFLQNYNIIVHPRCVHAQYELTHYSYVVEKKTGVVTPILEDKKNHVIDPLRYSVEKLRAASMGLTW